VFTYLIGDTNISARDIYVKIDRQECAIASFALPACIPSVAAAEPQHQGLRIGPSWPDDWLRVDQWKQFAEAADVHPKTVFTIMGEFAAKVPQVMRHSIQKHYKTTMPRGAAAEMIRTASTRATRMHDLLMAAGHQQQVAGLPKTPLAPKAGHDLHATHPGDETSYE
jgi:hypothetical protein